MKNIAKEIIAIDRIARKKVELLEIEKKQLTGFIKAEKERLLAQYTIALNNEIEATKKANQENIKIHEMAAKEEQATRLSEMEAFFLGKRDEWIDRIYADLIK